jgi:CheY-like chemotaxis protein
MLSSADRNEDAARCRELGVAVYLRKPIKQSDLLDAILNALGQAHSIAGVEAPPAIRDAQSVITLRVLLAEDNKINQKLAASLLRKQGHVVVIAGTGLEALEALEREPFDVVLMDVQMPEMDGLTAAAAIREKEKGTNTHLPIVALTAHAMKGDRERCLAVGMDAYVSKPLRAEELFEALAQVIPIPTDPPSEDAEKAT